MKALIARDLALATRAGGGFGLALAFYFLVIVLVPFAVGPESAILQQIAPGMLWFGALLAALLSLDRIFQLDWEDGSLELLATAPLPLESVVLAKSLAHWLSTGLPLVALSPLLAILINLPPETIPWAVASLFLGTPGLSAIGSFGAALTVGVKRGGLLLSLLVLPLYVPSLLFGALALRQASTGQDPLPSLALLAGISLASAAALPFAGAGALRANLR